MPNKKPRHLLLSTPVKSNGLIFNPQQWTYLQNNFPIKADTLFHTWLISHRLTNAQILLSQILLSLQEESGIWILPSSFSQYPVFSTMPKIAHTWKTAWKNRLGMCSTLLGRCCVFLEVTAEAMNLNNISKGEKKKLSSPCINVCYSITVSTWKHVTVWFFLWNLIN